MALVTQSNSGAAFSSLLAPFTGVDNATVRLLKAISVAELATLRDGDMVYVESVRDYWKWVPASTATDDSTGAAAQLRYCNPTVNGANPGRFERLFICSPNWLLQDFFIDTTAGVGHNENTGGSTLVPLNNDNELYQRWGSTAKVATPRLVTYLQSPSTQTNYDVQIMGGGSLKLLGTKTVVLSSVALTAVTIQNRATQTPWDITAVGLGAAHVGLIVQILTSGTPANVGAYAVVLKDLGGGKVRVSPFGTSIVSATLFTVITPTVGDTIEVISMPTLNVGTIKIRSGAALAISATPTNCVVLDLLNLLGSPDAGATTVGKISSDNIRVFYFRASYASMRFSGANLGAGGQQTPHLMASGVFKTTSSNVENSSLITQATAWLGSGGILNLSPGSNLVASKDCISQSGPATGHISALATSRLNSQGTAFFDSAGVGLSVNQGAFMFQSGAVADWGTNNATFGIQVFNGGMYAYSLKPTINATLGVGRETKIGGTDKLYGAVPYVEGANLAALVLNA